MHRRALRTDVLLRCGFDGRHHRRGRQRPGAALGFGCGEGSSGWSGPGCGDQALRRRRPQQPLSLGDVRFISRREIRNVPWLLASTTSRRSRIPRPGWQSSSSIRRIRQAPASRRSMSRGTSTVSTSISYVAEGCRFRSLTRRRIPSTSMSTFSSSTKDLPRAPGGTTRALTRPPAPTRAACSLPGDSWSASHPPTHRTMHPISITAAQPSRRWPPVSRFWMGRQPTWPIVSSSAWRLRTPRSRARCATSPVVVCAGFDQRAARPGERRLQRCH
jgi:hypothetical protein